MATKKLGSAKATKKATKKAATKRGATTKATAGGSAVAISSQQAAGVVSPALQELIGRAITDRDFRKALFADREKATRGYKLTPIDRESLNRIRPADLEQQAAMMANKVNITIMVKITIHF
ncbi:MAG: hypothetical protein DMF64_14025 [Acidobacteria bacterium]|nr:MAG: hypothetical protein DMF64_14025 [Acidobacteriota bacterium]